MKNLQNIFEQAIEDNDIDIVEKYINEKSLKLTTRDHWAITRSASLGYFKIVQLLIKDERINATANFNKPLKYAAANGHLKTVKALLNCKYVASSTTYICDSIVEASKHKHYKICFFLLSFNKKIVYQMEILHRKTFHNLIKQKKMFEKINQF